MPLGIEDLDEISALYDDAAVMEYVDGGTRTREQTKSALAAAARCWRAEGWGLWAIRDAETGGLIGEAGLQHLFGVEGASVDFGFTIARRFWRDRYATEAGHVILADAWDRYPGDLIHAVTHPANEGSEATLHTLGFRLAEERLVHGQMRNVWEIQRTR
jgi:RimJ/RimL family protein N-acetyltransferase